MILFSLIASTEFVLRRSLLKLSLAEYLFLAVPGLCADILGSTEMFLSDTNKKRNLNRQ